MKMKKAMAGVFAGIVAVSAMATSAISVNAAETTQTERKASVSFDSASTSWVFSAKGRMFNDGQLVGAGVDAQSMADAQASGTNSASVTSLLTGTFDLLTADVKAAVATDTGLSVGAMDKDALISMMFPTQIEDLKITFTGTKAGTTNKTVTATVTPKQKNSGNWAYYTMGISNPVNGGKSQSTLNLSDFNLAKAIDFKVTAKVYNTTEYRDADAANAALANSVKFYTPDASGSDGKEYVKDSYGETWSIDGGNKDAATLYSSSLYLTSKLAADKDNGISTNVALALMQAVFGTGDIDNNSGADLGDNLKCIQSEYMDVTTNDYRTLTKDSKPYETSDTNNSLYASNGRYSKAKGLAFEDLKANLTRYVVDIVGNSKGSTMTFNMVKAASSPFSSSSNNLDDFGWNWADNVKQFSIGINNQRTSAIQMQAEGSGNSDSQIEISWDKLVERSGLAVNALGLVDDIFIASNDPEFHIASLDVYRPANTFEDLSAGEPTVDSEDTLSSVDTTVATSEAPVVTAPAVDTTAAPATTPTVTPNPGTGNAPIALAVIPVAIAAAAIIAKKRK